MTTNPYDPLSFIKAANAKSKKRLQENESLIASSEFTPAPGGSGLVVPMSGSGQLPDFKGKFLMPVAGAKVTSDFGPRIHPIKGSKGIHTGTDFAARMGTPVYAVADGIVERATSNGGAYGNQVIVNLGGGLEGMYGHLSKYTVQPGQRVRKGQVVGYVGSTGLSTGPHLHFETRYKGTPVNPHKYLGR
ncbi:MAG TPA: M23 family metallopeptidase [Patescibacteria group bacterium]|nr:M23 family metallopeptidase [Patescibacteria group bacterium]